MEKNPFKWAWLIILFALVLGVGYIITSIGEALTKPAIEMHENRGKISLYKVQEVEALERYKELSIIKDSIRAKLDSVTYKDFEGIDSLGVQNVLNQIFNY